MDGRHEMSNEGDERTGCGHRNDPSGFIYRHVTGYWKDVEIVKC